jgi:hypothetical protein
MSGLSRCVAADTYSAGLSRGDGALFDSGQTCSKPPTSSGAGLTRKLSEETAW